MNKNIIKQLFCNHEYMTVTNLYGDAVHVYGGVRSIQECTKCGKRKYSSCIDIECQDVNKM